MSFSIELHDKKPKKIHNILTYVASIKINDFYETLHIPVDWWDINEYKQQWKEAVENLRKHGKSCLIVAIHNPKIDLYLNWWVLYKEGNTVYIQNQMFIDHTYKEFLGNTIITRENCYNFISERSITNEYGDKISEWSVTWPELVAGMIDNIHA